MARPEGRLDGQRRLGKTGNATIHQPAQNHVFNQPAQRSQRPTGADPTVTVAVSRCFTPPPPSIKPKSWAERLRTAPGGLWGMGHQKSRKTFKIRPGSCFRDFVLSATKAPASHPPACFALDSSSLRLLSPQITDIVDEEGLRTGGRASAKQNQKNRPA
jgi:hypothetical protein